MINPLTAISTAAAAIGITSTVEAGDEQELNMILSDQTDFPIVALVRSGIDAERNTFRPGQSYSYNNKHICLVYLLDKSNLDDTGTARNTALQALYETGMQLASRIQVDGSTSNQLRQPAKLSLSAIPYNMFDLNLDGLVFMVEIPDTFTYCVPVPTPAVTFSEITVGVIGACAETSISVDITVDAGEIDTVAAIYSGANTGTSELFSVGETWAWNGFTFFSGGTTSLFIRVTFTDASTQDSDPIEFETLECGAPP